MEGQYLTPTPVIAPPYRADLSRFCLIISCETLVVWVAQHGICIKPFDPVLARNSSDCSTWNNCGSPTPFALPMSLFCSTWNNTGLLVEVVVLPSLKCSTWNNGGGVSPSRRVQAEKSHDEAFRRGGVPVLSLKSVNPMDSSDSESLFAAGLPSPPLSLPSFPIHILPRRDVPDVITTAFAWISPDLSVDTPAHRVFVSSRRIAVAMSSTTVRFWHDSTTRCILSEYSFFAHCVLVAWTAGPRLLFKIFDCRAVASAFLPISPPRASSS